MLRRWPRLILVLGLAIAMVAGAIIVLREGRTAGMLPSGRVDGPVFVELGQFAAPIERADGGRGFLLVQARLRVADQALALRVSSALPAARHGGLRAVYQLAARGEGLLDVENTAEIMRVSINTALGETWVEAVYIDRLLVQ